jgi:hypothetical protein
MLLQHDGIRNAFEKCSYVRIMKKLSISILCYYHTFFLSQSAEFSQIIGSIAGIDTTCSKTQPHCLVI